MRLLDELREMHTYCRPHGSKVEQQFIDRYVASLPNAWKDAWDNWHVETDPTSRTIYSCHTDTVHRKGARQGVRITNGIMHLTEKSAKWSQCLGADDTVGVFLMRQMILADRAGHYIFHYGEEAGCIGSRSLANMDPKFLDRFDHAIAFDRKGKRDVITHQCGSRTCSDSFALALALQLNRAVDTLKYQPCDTGLFTDTDSYSEDVAECTNLSIGYSANHSHNEEVDTRHVLKLLLALLQLDAFDLPVDRDPSLPDPDDYNWRNWSYHGGSLHRGSSSTLRQDVPTGKLIDHDCRLYPADYIDDDAYDDEDDDTINEYAKDLALEDDDLDEETLMRRHPFIADPLDDRYCEMCGWVRDEHLIRNEHNERSIVIRKDDR